MPPSASIKINAVSASNDDLPIDVLVNLDNANTGGEVAFAWAIVDQPAGAADALSSTNTQVSSFTPKKEGTYLLQLTVNSGPSQLVDRKIVGIRFLKTRERTPAAQEDVQDGAMGWKPAVSAIHQRLDNLYNTEHGVIIGVNDTGGVLNYGDLVYPAALTSIKAGLPGEEKVPFFAFAEDVSSVAVQNAFNGLICASEGAPDGTPNVPANGIFRARYHGTFIGFTDFPGTWVVGSDVYCGISSHRIGGSGSFSIGSFARKIGSIIDVNGGLVSAFLDGTGTVGKPHFCTFGASVLSNAGGDTFLFPGYANSASAADELSFALPFPCHLFGLRVRAFTASTGGNIQQLTLRVNGVDSTVTATLGAGFNNASDVSGNIAKALTSSDRISIKATNTVVGVTAPAEVAVTFGAIPLGRLQ
jgi:hypothetical protein